MQELVKELLELLSRTSFSKEQMQHYVNRLDESFKWEGVPYVEIEEEHYIVTIYERGVPSLTKKLNQKEEVLYWLLEDMIFTAVHVEMLNKYGVDNMHTHLDYSSEEVKQEMNENIQTAFGMIGDPYLTWHQKGKRKELESYQPKKGNSER